MPARPRKLGGHSISDFHKWGSGVSGGAKVSPVVYTAGPLWWELYEAGFPLQSQIANIHWIIQKASEFQKNLYFCFIDYAKAFDCVDHNKLWKILQEMGIPDYLTCLLRNLHAGQEATVRTDMEWRTGSKLGKEYVKAVYCHPAYLTHMHSTSHEMPGWMKLKLVSRLPGEISITSDNWWSLLKIQVSGPSPRLV